jgi:hypothetical protein
LNWGLENDKIIDHRERRIQVRYDSEGHISRRDEVFKDEIGCVKGIKANLHLKQDVVPKFVKARPKVEQELDKLEKQNILTPVQVSDWASRK